MTNVYEFTVEKLMSLGGEIQLSKPLSVVATLTVDESSNTITINYSYDLPCSIEPLIYTRTNPSDAISKGMLSIWFEQKLYPVLLAYYFSDISCGVVRQLAVNLNQNNIVRVMNILDWNDFNQCWNFFQHETVFSKNADIDFWKLTLKYAQMIDRLHQANLIFFKIRTYGFSDKDNNKDIETLLHAGNGVAMGTINWMITKKIEHLENGFFI